MKKIIINADDFGLTNGINYAIVDAYKHGVLTSATLMANMPAAMHAITLAKENPKLAVGVHLTLTVGKPILSVENSLTVNGKFHSQHYYMNGGTIVEQELYDEWDAQIQYLLNEGLVLSHIDSHHHAHSFDQCANVAKKLAHKYNLPLRQVIDDGSDIKFSSTLDELARKQTNMKSSQEEIEKYFDQEYNNAEIIEFMCHPGYVDHYILTNSSYNIERANVCEYLINSSMAKYIQECPNIKLVNYFNAKK